MTPRRIVGVEKNYDWGDEITIRHSMGLPSTRGTKIAELWWGTHPQGPAHLDSLHGPLLSDVTGPMTMLVKLIACAQPLSLQTHPTKEQAEKGFAREEALGIPRDAPHRMYRDDSDKPEMIVALSRFEALCGFAPIGDSVQLLESIGWNEEAQVLSSRGTTDYLRWAFQQTEIPVLTQAPEWLQRIASLYPTDPALRIAPLLNHVTLQPGQALSLPAGNLHAYLHGFGLEVMNSSDNVIRAGFTSKHVDVEELLNIADITPLQNPIVVLNELGEFPSPSTQFTIGKGAAHISSTDKHRIVYGIPLPDVNHRIVWPEAYLFAAGDRSAVLLSDAWVCIQN